MTTKDNIIFLDIDGPIISTGCYGIDNNCSLQRTVMNSNAIGFMNILCRNTNAKIVTNSSHNYHLVENKCSCDMQLDLRDSLILHGIKSEYFHEQWRTNFTYERRFSGESDIKRLIAINDWVEKNNPSCRWVCFDDIKFTDLPQLIVVDFDLGITYQNANDAYKLLKETDLNIII